MAISIERVIEKLDVLVDAKEFASAKRHLEYWAGEAKAEGDVRALISIDNELIGYYRKNNYPDECFALITELISLVNDQGLSDTVSGATAYLNCATGYKTFNKNKEALSLYRKAAVIYERDLSEDDTRLGGLFNNMAVALVAEGEYSEAENCYTRAISVISKYPAFRAEEAVTLLNMTDLLYNNPDPDIDKAEEYLLRAKNLLDTVENKNGDYAFVLEKCAPVFRHYGYLEIAEELQSIADKIYEGLKL